MLIAKLSLSAEHDVAGVLLFIFTSCPLEVDRHTIALQRRYATLCEDMSIFATQPSPVHVSVDILKTFDNFRRQHLSSISNFVRWLLCSN